MGLKEVVIVGIAMAMDALGVTISLGVNIRTKRDSKVKCILSFAIFQFLFILFGGILGKIFDTYIVSIPNIIGGATIVIIGIIMIVDGLKDNTNENSILDNKYMHIILGISVSIDALVVGFTAFHHIGGYLLLFVDSILVGLITLLICVIGFYFCKYVRKINFVCKYADLFGGIILILFGLKMICF